MATLSFSFFFIIISFLFSSYLLEPSVSLPFVVLHGISDSCSGSGVKTFTERLANWTGTEGYCVEIADGAWDSWFMPIMEQMEIACKKVKKIDALSDGYHLIGLSQGAIIGRALIEFCDEAPQVINFISLAGPHAGIAAIPFCSGEGCLYTEYLMEFLGVYSAFIQKHLAPSNYIKITKDYKKYIKGCKFLPQVNNEIEATRNSTYKERFESLEKLVLIMFENDTVLVPKETSWFGYYENGTVDTLLPANETELYIEDWIGLKTLDEAGKVEYFKVPGGHLAITESEMEKYIVPYLGDSSVDKPVDKSSSGCRWWSRLWNWLIRLLDF
ncbi:Palmitoyl-protein thioesterase 1-like protein [Drosera capensis]